MRKMIREIVDFCSFALGFLPIFGPIVILAFMAGK